MGKGVIVFAGAALLATVAAAVALTQRASASSSKVLRPGRLRVQLTFKPGLPGRDEKERAASKAIAERALAAVPGAFMGKLDVSPLEGEGQTVWLDPQGVTQSTGMYVAHWPHATMGPIKESARKAVEASLRAYVPQLSTFNATRVS